MELNKRFAALAESKCGSRGSEFQSTFNLSSNSSWSAAFVSWCAKELNISTSSIPRVTRCQDIRNLRTSGTWVGSDKLTQSVQPEIGDIAFLSWSSSKNNRADCVGIVSQVTDSTVSLIIGDVGSYGSSTSTVRLITYQKSLSCIQGYIKPDWSTVDG